MFYLRTSSLRHKIMQDNFGSGSSGSVRVGSWSDWESSRFRITARYLYKETAKWPFRFSSQAATCYYRYQSNHSKVEAIPLSALPKDTTSELSSEQGRVYHMALLERHCYRGPVSKDEDLLLDIHSFSAYRKTLFFARVWYFLVNIRKCQEPRALEIRPPSLGQTHTIPYPD